MLKGKKILIVDDDIFIMHTLLRPLYVEGCNVICATNFADGFREITKHSDIDLAIFDIRLPVGNVEGISEDEYDPIALKSGFASGLILAQWAKRNRPDLPLIGFSIEDDSSEAAQWFRTYGAGYLQKTVRPVAFKELVEHALAGRGAKILLKTFIVHGHDENSKYALKNYLQNTLKLSEPIILHEQPSLGRSIIEKFEDIAKDVNVVFVLLTPDEIMNDALASNEVKRRARQNVIFEMGYFLASLQRKKGRVILLYKGELELPSDIAGLIYIDISNGVEAAGELIRRELGDLI
jgi:predicted nucleotide-binding protein